MTISESLPMPGDPRIAVAIPCYNEAAAIGFVIERYRAALPDAEIVVFDNNSTDGTGAIARDLGVRVVDVPPQGKGHAVQAAFVTLKDFDLLVLTDGDGTYPAEYAQAMIQPILDGRADMTVGFRRPVEGENAMAPIRGIGNVLIRLAFRVLIGSNPGDLLSGYRVFNKNFREMVRLRGGGFEVETELASEAIGRGLRVVDVPVSYYPRVTGSVSKLNAFRDGRRILWTIVKQSFRLRPWRPIILWDILLLLATLITRIWIPRPSFMIGLLLVPMILWLWVLRQDTHDRRPDHPGKP